jgi:hypothetical protein
VPGRKTDVKDAEWIADLLCHGLLRSSFVPPKSIRELRDLTRYRRKLVQQDRLDAAGRDLAHIPTHPTMTTDKCLMRRYTDTPLGMKTTRAWLASKEVRNVEE